MGFAAHRQKIESDFFTRFPLIEPDVELSGENAAFDPPVESPWVRVSMAQAGMFRACIGDDPSWQSDGIFSVQVFTPLTSGSAVAARIADSAVDVLRTAKLDGIETLDFTIAVTGQDDGWYQTNVLANYRAFDKRATP